MSLPESADLRIRIMENNFIFCTSDIFRIGNRAFRDIQIVLLNGTDRFMFLDDA